MGEESDRGQESNALWLTMQGQQRQLLSEDQFRHRCYKLKPFLFTWEWTSNDRPRLSANIRMMMLFRMVPKKVLIPNTKAHSSFVSDEAIWNLGRPKEEWTLKEVSVAKQKCCQQSLLKQTLNHILTDSRGYRHQELVESPEENVGNVADPDVVCGAHEKQQSCLDCCDHSNDQLGPQIPLNFHKASSKWGQRTWWRQTSAMAKNS